MDEVAEDERPVWLRRYEEEYLTLDEVGQLAGVTREAVRQRLRRLGISPRTAKETNELRWRRATTLHAQEISAHFLRSRSIEEAADAVGLPLAWVKRHIAESIPDYEVLTTLPRAVAKRYSTDDLIASLRDASAGTRGILTADRYRDYVAAHPTLDDGRARPGAQAMALRYGSWRAALEAAGLPANPHSGPEKQFDLQTATEAVVEYWRDLGYAPTVAGYERWQQAHQGRPSAATIRKLTGSWSALTVWAWQIVHGITLEADEDEAAVPVASEVGAGAGVFVEYRAADEGVQISLPSAMVALNYEALERAVRSHARIQNAVASAAANLGLTAWSPTANGPAFDVALSRDDASVLLVEVKSATAENLEFQLRVALGQVLRYTHRLRVTGENVTPAIAVELRPDAGWSDLLASLGVGLIVEESLTDDLRELGSVASSHLPLEESMAAL